MSKKTQIRQKHHPSIKKNPTAEYALSVRKNLIMNKQNESSASQTLHHHPVWQFKNMDIDHERWGWKKLKGDVVFFILKKCCDYESRTWGEILSDKKRDHFVDVSSLTKKAQDRLKEIKLDDVDQLLRLRFKGKPRLWGIVDRHIFKIIWWDPEHEICLSDKKHT
jgi:hypothetical protein